LIDLLVFGFWFFVVFGEVDWLFWRARFRPAGRLTFLFFAKEK
jgi:hypothetical protein